LYPSIRQKEFLHSICLLEYNYVCVSLESLSNVGEPTGATITCLMSRKFFTSSHTLLKHALRALCEATGLSVPCFRPSRSIGRYHPSEHKGIRLPLFVFLAFLMAAANT